MWVATCPGLHLWAIYETYLATDAVGSGGMLAGSVAVGTNVYAVSSDTDQTGTPHIVVCTKPALAEQATPAALALIDESLNVSAVSFGDLDLDTLRIGGGLSFTPPDNPSSLARVERAWKSWASCLSWPCWEVTCGLDPWRSSSRAPSSARHHISIPSWCLCRVHRPSSKRRVFSQ